MKYRCRILTAFIRRIKRVLRARVRALERFARFSDFHSVRVYPARSGVAIKISSETKSSHKETFHRDRA